MTSKLGMINMVYDKTVKTFLIIPDTILRSKWIWMTFNGPCFLKHTHAKLHTHDSEIKVNMNDL